MSEDLDSEMNPDSAPPPPGDTGSPGGSSPGQDGSTGGGTGTTIPCGCWMGDTVGSEDPDPDPAPPLYTITRTVPADPDESAAPVPTTPPVARGGGAVNALAPPGHDIYPTLLEWPSTEGQFMLKSTDYNLSVGGEIKYVKGWIQYIIQLGDTVSWLTGGIGHVIDFGSNDPGTFSGGDWRYAQQSVNSATGLQYWTGSDWADVPTTWSDPDHVKLCGIGVWSEDGETKAQLGLHWPQAVPVWNEVQNNLRATTLPRWTSQIHTDWTNKWDLKRKDCPSTDAACCRYHPNINVAFVEAPKADSERVIVLGANNARSNSGAWSMGDNRPHMPSHEFGHHLGYPDEYVGGVRVDKSVNTDGATAGIDTNSLMGDGMENDATANVKKRHFRVVCKQLSLMLDRASGRKNSYVFDAVDKAS